MTDAPLTLADRALTRLRQLASGNGLEPVAIAVLEAQEQTFILTGTMEITPLCETETAAYPGGVRGKGRRPVKSVAALQEAVVKHRKEFQENKDWVEDAVKEIKSHDSQGWGLENAQVTLPHKSATYALTESCPSCGGRKMLTCAQCNGQGQLICTQCQGQGRERCYYCGGSGENPQQPGQVCTTCNGTRFAPCRFCQSRKFLPCPTCGGKRGTPCTSCQASGQITQEVTVTCGAETHFNLKADGLPSGLRRGLDRIGIAAIGKGHADITSAPPSKEELEDRREGAPILVLNYRAALPYAELRMGLGGKKAVISVVGKRCAIMGVPAFLDAPLQLWRDKLRRAALGQTPLEEAIEARALKDILSLTVSGKGRLADIRKLYPYGLSTEAIESILSDMRLALNKTTLKTRAIIATLCVIGSALLFYVYFDIGLGLLLTTSQRAFVGFITDIMLVALTLAASWAALNFSTRFVLKRRFPTLSLALQQKIGKTGYGMIGGVVAVFLICLWVAQTKPLWASIWLH